MWYGSTSGDSNRASPIPATLPCPKIPQQPTKKRCSTPSRSTYCNPRNRTSACAIVSRVTRGPRVRALAPAFHDREPWPHRQKRRGRGARIAKSRRHLHFVGVADDHRRAAYRFTRPAPRVFARSPEHRAVVQVVDGDLASLTPIQRGEGRGSAGLVGKSRARGPEERRGADRRQVEVGRGEIHIRGLGLAIEEEREMLRGMDLAEDDRRAEGGVAAHPPRVDAEVRERLAHVVPETIPPYFRDHAGAAS